MIEYHTYTAADVKAWLYEGVKNGLSEQVISKVRANAIIHNPFVEDDMVVVVSATDAEKVVGYTAMFPDYLERPKVRLTVPTTLYADPEYADEFIGYNVTKLLHDTANGRMVIGTDMAKEAALIDKLLGLKIERVDRKRYLLNRSIQVSTLRTLGSFLLEPYRRCKQRCNISKFLRKVSNDTQVEYTDFIDYEAYQFIVSHSNNDMYLRSQGMLNWRLRYGFEVKSPLCSRIKMQNRFGSNVEIKESSIAKVYEAEVLIGVYALEKEGKDIHVGLLFTDDKQAERVYDMLLMQVIESKPRQLFSQYEMLNRYIDSLGVSLKNYNDKFYYTHPTELPYTSKMQVQGIDGDMLA